MIRLFDIENNKVIPSVHCYTLNSLRKIMEEYPNDYLNIYSYLFYMSCPNPDLNPFFDYPELEKEEAIINEVGLIISTEDEILINALNLCKKMYETPTLRAYNGIKKMLDKIADYMSTSDIVDGRDGNGSFILRAAKDFDSIRQSFKSTLKDLLEEQKTSVRGDKRLAYDDN